MQKKREAPKIKTQAEQAQEQCSNAVKECKNMDPSKTATRLSTNPMVNPMNSPDFQQYMAKNWIHWWPESMQAALKDFQHQQKFWTKIAVGPWGSYDVRTSGTSKTINSANTYGGD